MFVVAVKAATHGNEQGGRLVYRMGSAIIYSFNSYIEHGCGRRLSWVTTCAAMTNGEEYLLRL
jgi:hypothetical protein